MSILLDLLIPPRCLACLTVSPDGLCGDCAVDLANDGKAHPLAPGVIAVSAFVYEDPLSTAIKRVKTDAMREGASKLATLLSTHLPAGTPRT